MAKAEKKYYTLHIATFVDENDEEYGCYDVTVEDDSTDWPWLQGLAFNELPSTPIKAKLNLEDENAGSFADFIPGAVPLVTEKFRKILDSCKVTNVEYYEVDVAGSEEFDEFPKYFAINIIGLVSVTGSKAKVQKTFQQSGADIVEKPDLKIETDLDIFRVMEHLGTEMVSEQIRKACIKAKIDSVEFIATEKWQT